MFWTWGSSDIDDVSRSVCGGGEAVDRTEGIEKTLLASPVMRKEATSRFLSLPALLEPLSGGVVCSGAE